MTYGWKRQRQAARRRKTFPGQLGKNFRQKEIIESGAGGSGRPSGAMKQGCKMKKLSYQKPQLLAFEGWDSMFAVGSSFNPPDPGCFLPGMEDNCAETGVIEG